MTPEETYVFNLVTIHFARMFRRNMSHQLGAYFATVMRTRLINYELVAGDEFLDRFRGPQ